MHTLFFNFILIFHANMLSMNINLLILKHSLKGEHK